MKLPHFSLSRFGTVSVQSKKEAYHEEMLSAYEFEFYTEDHTGGSITDGVFRPARKGYYNLFRPGQRQRLVPPYRCYFLNIITQDPELCDYFDHMPDTGMLWNMDAVVSLLQEMTATEDKRTLAGRLRLQSCAGRIFALLVDQRLTGDQPDRVAFAHRNTLQRVDRYIREHLAEDLSLKCLAEISNLDPTYLHKLYTSAYGKTPAQRTLAYRISAAKIALAEGRLPLSEIASRCGFSSQAYFSCKFKQITGKTPSQYRNRKKE